MNELHSVRVGIWFVGVLACIFGVSDRSVAALADRLIDAVDLVQMFTAAIVFVGFLFLAPTGQGEIQ